MPEERKLVTILFADVTGSTALGEALDPEDVRALMGRYYAHARDVVAHHGGTIEKFIGDAVMAVFGLPQAHGDDAERAIAAALALHKAVAHDEVLGENFQLRIGVNTGEVVATNDPSSGDFLVTGDAVNVAARLQQNANPGDVIASERTMRAAEQAFLFEPARLIEVKGKSQPLHIYPVIGPRPTRKVERPPFIGRKQDLMQLNLLLARVQEEQRPQLVSIVAPAGTGKTRLLEEFLSHLDADEDFSVATVRCLPYGQTLTYWPMHGLLEELLGGDITRTAVEHVFMQRRHNYGKENCRELTRTAVEHVFMQSSYTREDASRLTDLILATIGITGDGQSSAGINDRESIFSAWRLLIEVFASQAPRIIIFEDLHWASESMLDLVEHITNVRTQAALLLIALSRPELLDRRPNWGGGRQNFTSLALQPLTTKQTQDLVQRLAADMPEAVRKRIIERSGGNPFFALELIRSLIERGLSREATSLDALPDTVHAAVLARIDQLTKTERAALQVASVATRTIRAAMLQTVLAEYSRQEIEEALLGLQMRDMIVPVEGDAFTFRHILIRDVAYGTLSRSERVRLHSKIADWLETAAGERVDEYIEVLAYHYREAVLLAKQSAVPRAIPVETEKAVHFLRLAGEKISRAGAINEAAKYFQYAIDLAPESKLLKLYEAFGDSMPWGEVQANAYRKAIEYWRKQEAKDRQPLVGARLIRKQLVVATRGGANQSISKKEANALRVEMRSLAEAAGDEAEIWRVRTVDTFWYPWYERLDENVTRQELEQRRVKALAAANYFEQLEDWASFSEALDGYTYLSRLLGIFDDIPTGVQRRLAVPDLPLAERIDALNVLAFHYFAIEQYEPCLQTIREALAQLPPGVSLTYMSSSLAFALFVTFISGRWSELNTFVPVFRDAYEQAQLDRDKNMAQGFFAWYQIATAQENRAAADKASAILCRIFPEEAPGGNLVRAFLEAYREDSIEQLHREIAEYASRELERNVPIIGFVAFLSLMFFNEHEVTNPEALLKLITKMEATDIPNIIRSLDEIAQALAADDNQRLAQAIENAEEHGLIPHAARMRLVLAQRIQDRSQLERARPVLEQLQDRRHLRKLAEIEAALA
jgi:class 3 adenylate cyclase